MLYLISADAVSLPLELVCPPGHAYLRYSGEGQRRNIETTSAGRHLTEVQYLAEIEKRLVSEIPHPEQVKDTEWYFATKSRRQFAALLLINRTVYRAAEAREKDYFIASRIAPDLPFVFQHLAHFHMNSGNLELAEEFATRALGLAGPWPAMHLVRGAIRASRENQEGCLEDMEAAIRYAPRSAFLHLGRAELLRDFGRTREAVDAYSQSLDLNPVQADARRHRAYLYMTAMKDYARAFEDYSAIIGEGPSGVSDFYNRGICQAKMKRYAQATEDFSRAIDLEPRNADLYTWRAQTYAFLGDEVRWEADFNKAKELRAKP